ncbi:MAG: tetratricopeptide repeat protein [Bacteroidetes bacterium]|nr:tetratricopeptide repeat protein [Bacteroidota bacterium]
MEASKSEEEWKKIAALRARVLNRLSISFLNRGMAKESLPHAEESLKLYFQSGSKQEVANALNCIGTISTHLSDYPNALDYFQKALEMHKVIGNSDSIADNLGSIGIVYKKLSNYSKALDCYQKALEIYKEIGNKNGIAANLGSIGLVYMNLSDSTKAQDYYLKAIEIYNEFGDKKGIAKNLGNLGIVNGNLSNYPEALDYFQQALDIYKVMRYKNGIASNLVNIGNVYTKLLDNPKALYYYQEALEIYHEIGYKFGIAVNLGNIGPIYAKKEFEGYDLEKAEDYMHRSIALGEEIDNKESLYHAHLALSELYEMQERWKDSQIHFKKYHSLKEEVYSEEAKKQAELMEYRRKIEESERDRQVKLARFQEQEKILLNILPEQIAERILDGEKQIADLHENVSVFFSDIVGFTQLSQKVTPDELLSMLNEIFTEFDRIARNHGLEKIKTIGDAYMAVAGVPLAQEDHAQRAAAFAMEVIEYMKAYRKKSNSDLQIRVGLHCGKAIAGVIGENKFAYDLWGDSVNTASRMESHGEAGRIHISEDFKSCLTQTLSKGKGLKTIIDFIFEPRGEMEVKGKGKMKTYFLEKTN